MKQALGRRCRHLEQPVRQGVTVERAYLPGSDLVTTLGRGRDHLRQIPLREIGPFGRLAAQGGVRHLDVDPTLVVELQLVGPRLVPQGMRNDSADTGQFWIMRPAPSE